MKIDLLKTYDNMINNSKTTQRELDNCYNAIYMDYFVRPDLRVNQRAGHKSNGDFVEGLHIYPDKKCICEILTQIQDRLNSDTNVMDKLLKNKLGAVLFISELVNYYITDYFGGTENIHEVDNVFYDNFSERMANLSDFKNKSCAVCIERGLAAYVVLSVIANNEDLKKSFPFKPYLSIINFSSDIYQKGPIEEHALCGLISRDDYNEMYLLDPSNYGLVEDKNGNKKYVYGLYELSEDEIQSMFNKECIVPTLFRCKHLDNLTQLSHRALSKNPRYFEKYLRECNGMHK